MRTPPPIPILARGTALAADGDWRAVYQLLAETFAPVDRPSVDVQSVDLSPALIVLFAESALRTGQPIRARTVIEQCDAILRLSGDQASIRRSVNLLGAACLEQGDLLCAELTFDRAIPLARSDADDLLLGRCFNNLAVIASIRGRLDEALGLYALAVPAYQRIGNVNGIAECCHNMAIAYRKLQRFEQSDEQERRAAEYAHQVGNHRLVALTRAGRAELFLLRGDPVLAEVAAVRASNDLAAIPDQARQADAIRVAGLARLALGKIVIAVETLTRAVDLSVDSENRLIEAECRWARAQAFDAAGNIGAAGIDARDAMQQFRQLSATRESTAISAWMSERGIPLR